MRLPVIPVKEDEKWEKHFDLLEDLSKVYVWSGIENYIAEISQ